MGSYQFLKKIQIACIDVVMLCFSDFELRSPSLKRKLPMENKKVAQLEILLVAFNPLSANPTKCSNTFGVLRSFVIAPKILLEKLITCFEAF